MDAVDVLNRLITATLMGQSSDDVVRTLLSETTDRKLADALERAGHDSTIPNEVLTCLRNQQWVCSEEVAQETIARNSTYLTDLPGSELVLRQCPICNAMFREVQRVNGVDVTVKRLHRVMINPVDVLVDERCGCESGHGFKQILDHWGLSVCEDVSEFMRGVIQRKITEGMNDAIQGPLQVLKHLLQIGESPQFLLGTPKPPLHSRQGDAQRACTLGGCISVQVVQGHGLSLVCRNPV